MRKMYNNPYFNPQISLDRINTQIAELEKMKTQMQQPIQPPTSLTQNFQIAPNNSVMKYANNIEEVQKDMVIGDTPYFSKDMSVVWIKNNKGEIKAYTLAEIVQKDEKDIQIEYLQAQIEELKKGNNYESNNEYINEPIENEKSRSSKTVRGTKKK
jgi:ribonuclease HII